ncbi:hypothetical protein K469DRAFT_12665 [Zopfia rhizophila CBS 207.26]|uniref:Uncharacterized protein n=1 Tax=Zopfia rhizophila CBS 207.26 TaxID=1314779 RepID=A0A6A6EZ97_9PEZI|nr:hypothetical protein K469DRAFT_12665 [Zopfia rhizophila CBS 207.26]
MIIICNSYPVHSRYAPRLPPLPAPISSGGQPDIHPSPIPIPIPIYTKPPGVPSLSLTNLFLLTTETSLLLTIPSSECLKPSRTLIRKAPATLKKRKRRLQLGS